MTSETKVLYIDTNAFLQVRDLKDIPWTDLFNGARAIDLMVAPRVIEELDNHKSSTSQRRRDRARAALRLIDEASLETDFSLVIREEPLRVRIVISNAPRLDWASYPTLDPAKPDDQLVAEALSYGNGAAVFSHDSGPRIRARIAGLPSFEPVPEWLLPIEQTDEQRRVTALERELKRALSSNPTILASFDNLDEAASEIRLIVPVLKPLDQEQINRLSNDQLAKHPRASLNSRRFSSLAYQISGVSDSEIERYNQEYSAFESNVRAYYGNLHQVVRSVGSACAVSYYVKNDSGVSAKGLRIEFDIEGNGWLLADRSHWRNLKSLRLPAPPEKPRSPMDNILRSSALGSNFLPPQRDPVGFYWFDRPKIGATHSALQCQDFRATRVYRDTIFVDTVNDLPAKISLRLHISAENLPAPINISVRLEIVEQTVDWADQVVQEILSDVQK